MENKCEFTDLVDDVIQIIFSYLYPWEMIGIFRTSKKFYDNFKKSLKIYDKLSIDDLNRFSKLANVKFSRSDNDFEKILIESSRFGFSQLVKYSINTNGTDIITLCGDKSICNACEYGHLEIVKFLAENGANILANNNYTLKWACLNGHTEIVKFIVNLIKDKQILNKNYIFALDVCERGHLDTLKFLMENCSYQVAGLNDIYLPLFIKAHKKGHLNIVKYIIDISDEPSKMAIFKNSCKEGYTDIVKLLINKNIIQKIGNESLIEACKNERTEIVKLLINNNADVHYNNDEPFNIANKQNNFDIVELLVKNSVNIHTTNKIISDYTFHFEYNYQEKIRILKFIFLSNVNYYSTDEYFLKDLVRMIGDRIFDFPKFVIQNTTVNGRILIQQYIINQIPDKYNNTYYKRMVEFKNFLNKKISEDKK